MKKDTKPSNADKFESQTLTEQAEEILAYLDSSYPAQTVVPDGRVELLRRTLGRLEKQRDDL